MSDKEKKGQHWDPERYALNARFVADLGEPLLALLDPKPGEHILDLGCGDGPLTLKLMAAGAEVLGIDSSVDQIKAARAKGVNAEVGDGMNLSFNAIFDAVFSNGQADRVTHDVCGKRLDGRTIVDEPLKLDQLGL